MIIDKDNGYIVTNEHVVHDAEQIIVRIGRANDVEGTLIGVDARTDLAVIKVKGPRRRRGRVGRLGEDGGRRLGDRRRQPVRPRADGDRRDRLGDQPPRPDPGRPLRGLHPDRRRDQPRQLRRPADQPRGPGHRDQHGDHPAAARGEARAADSRRGSAWRSPPTSPGRSSPRSSRTARSSAAYLGIVPAPVHPGAGPGPRGCPRSRAGPRPRRAAPTARRRRRACTPGDVVVRLDSKDVEDPSNLRTRAFTLPIGSKVPVEFFRGGKKQSVDVTVEAMPERVAVNPRSLGFEVVDLPPDAGPGVRVVRVVPGSPAQAAGLREGMKVVDRRPPARPQPRRVRGGRRPASTPIQGLPLGVATPEGRLDFLTIPTGDVTPLTRPIRLRIDSVPIPRRSNPRGLTWTPGLRDATPVLHGLARLATDGLRAPSGALRTGATAKSSTLPTSASSGGLVGRVLRSTCSP